MSCCAIREEEKNRGERKKLSLPVEGGGERRVRRKRHISLHLQERSQRWPIKSARSKGEEGKRKGLIIGLGEEEKRGEQIFHVWVFVKEKRGRRRKKEIRG